MQSKEYALVRINLLQTYLRLFQIYENKLKYSSLYVIFVQRLYFSRLCSLVVLDHNYVAGYLAQLETFKSM